MQIVLVVLLCIIILWLITGFIVFYIACKRRKEISWESEQAILKSNYAPHARLIQNSILWLDSHTKQDVFINSKDGLRLRARWVPAPDAKGTILLFHGYRSTPYADFGMVLDMYHNMGLNLLIPDQRSHGQSQGSYITFGVLESEDALLWIQYHNRQLFSGPVFLSGLSMGASTVMYTLDKEIPDNVKAVIVDCGFSSPAEIVSKVFRDTLRIPGSWVIPAATVFSRIFAGFSFYERDSKKILGCNQLPILMVHGQADDFVPCSMTQEGYDCCNSEKYLLIVPGAGHGLSFLGQKEGYVSLVRSLIEKNIHLEERYEAHSS